MLAGRPTPGYTSENGESGKTENQARNAMYGILSLLDTPLSKRSDDDQEMKIWRPAHFWTAAARRAAAHIT